MLKNEKGMGVAITLMALILISLLGTAIVIRSISLAQVVNQKNYSITAVEAAKAGIACGIYEVESDIFYDEDIPVSCVADYTGVTSPSEKGYYEVFVTNNLTGASPLTSSRTGYDIPAGSVELLSLGYAGNPSATEAKKKMRVIAIGHKLVSVTFPMNYAVFGGEHVGGSGNGGGWAFFSDSFDSRDGQYDPDNPGENGDIGSNGTLDIPRMVNGDVHVTEGHEGDVSEYTGEVVVMSAMEMPTPVPPPMNYIGTNITSTSSPGPGEYGNINIGGHDKVTLTSGEYIFTGITSTGNSEILINTVDINDDGEVDPVKIWVKGDIKITGSTIVYTGPPTNLLIYGTEECESVVIQGSGSISAAVYAPNADIDGKGMGNTRSEIYGCLVGKTVDFSGAKVNVHYDEALAELGGGEEYLGLDKDNISWVIELQ